MRGSRSSSQAVQLELFGSPPVAAPAAAVRPSPFPPRPGSTFSAG